MKSAAMFSPVPPPSSGFDETAVPATAPGTERKALNNRFNPGAGSQATPSWESGYQNQQTEQQQFAAAQDARAAAEAAEERKRNDRTYNPRMGKVPQPQGEYNPRMGKSPKPQAYSPSIGDY